VARLIVDLFDTAVREAKKLADSVYRFTAKDPKQAKRNRRLRMTSGYYGPPLEERLGGDEVTTIAATAGLGSFATYVLMGLGTAASADRLANEPLAMNNTPTPGTVERGVGHTLTELEDLDLGRFAAGAPLDLCLEIRGDAEPNEKADVVRAVIERFLDHKGHTLSLTLADTEQYREIYNLAVRASKKDEMAAKELLRYGNVLVRAGGWQTPFITMSLAQQKHYTQAAVSVLEPLDDS
jgi:pyruvate-formate lyase